MSSLAVRGSMRRSYEQVRLFHHPALARVLSDHYQARLQWDDPVVAVAHKWVTRVDREAYLRDPLLIAVLADITVHQGATLTLENNLTALYAHDVWIHRRGRMVQRGSYMKLWAATVSSFLASDQVTQQITQSPWRAGL